MTIGVDSLLTTVEDGAKLIALPLPVCFLFPLVGSDL